MAQRRKDVSIFKTSIIAALFGYWAYLIEPVSNDAQLLRWFCMLIAGFSLWAVVKEIPSPIYNWLLRRRAQKATDNHGSAYWASKKDIANYGMYDADGLYLGASAHDGRPIFQKGESHWMIYAPNRSGKSLGLIMTNIMHYFGSMLITDIKGELWDVTTSACKTVHNNTIIRLDPAGLKNEKYGVPARYNPMSRIIAVWENGQYTEVITKAKNIALQLLPEPSTPGENEFFRNGSRKVIVFAMVYLVVTSEKEANLTMVVALIQDNMAMQDALHIAMCSDVLSGDLARMAKDLLRKLEATDSNHWDSFCEGAVQVLDIYSASGLLAESSSTCDFNFSILKNNKSGKSYKIYIIVDPIRMNVLAQWLGLVIWCLLDELLSCDSRKEVILMLDEASNFRVDGLVDKLTLLAGYQCRTIMALQSFSAFEKTYSKQDLEILLDQCECRVWLKVQDDKVAERISKSLGHKTLVNTQHNLGHDSYDRAQENMSEMTRRLMTPDEIMKTPHTIIQLRGKAPILGDIVGYDAVKPWNKWAKPNTLYGKKPFISKTRICIDYPSLSWLRTCFGLIKRKPRVTFYRRIRQKRDYSNLPFTLIWIYRMMIFIAPLAALWWVIETHGTPYVLWEYSYRGSRNHHIKESCTYIGINGVKKRFGPDCPFIEFMD